MGSVRVCGGTCHKAKGATCRCWCGGVFHGSGGQDARDAFVRALGVDKVPTMERTFLAATGQQDLFTDPAAGARWRAAVNAAVEARTKPAPASEALAV